MPKENSADRDRLGEVVKAARTAKGLTQSHLAGSLGITTRYLKLIENSGRKPSFKLLACIVEKLDIPLDQIF